MTYPNLLVYSRPRGFTRRFVSCKFPMERLLQYISNHAILSGATVLVAIIAIAFELRQRGRAVAALAPAQAVRLINDGALVIDLRTAEAFATGHIIGARNVPAAQIAESIASLAKFRDKPIVLCGDAGSGAVALKQLHVGGFSKVAELRGGVEGWKQDNLPVVKENSKGKEARRS
jgi:rhodanese-related sulfurtransferase